MSLGDVFMESTEELFSVCDSRGQTIASFKVAAPTRIFHLVQDDPDEMDDPFATERMNSCQIRWNEDDKRVEVFTQISHVSDLLILELDYPTFFGEFRTWHKAMVKKYKEKK